MLSLLPPKSPFLRRGERIKNRRCQKSLETSCSGGSYPPGKYHIMCPVLFFFVGTLGVDDFPNFPRWWAYVI